MSSPPSTQDTLSMTWQPPQPRPAMAKRILPYNFPDTGSGQYAVLPTIDDLSDDTSDNATLAGDEDSSKPQSRAAHAVDLESMQLEDPATPPSFPWCDAIGSTIWHVRMCLVLMIFCTGATLFTSAFFGLVGNLAGLGAFEPYASMHMVNSGKNESGAWVVGACVVGCTVGMLAFVRLVVRRARMASGRSQSRDNEPEELFYAVLVAALGGVFALAAGIAVMPWLATEGFGIRHSVALGVWGLVAPLTPVLLSMFVATLWTCNPCAGAPQCCSEAVCGMRR